MDLRGFTNIIVGLVFIFFNFTINGFDIIPDFIGYLFIFAGLISVSKYCRTFSSAAAFAFLLLIMSAFSSFMSALYGLGSISYPLTEGVPSIVLWPISLVGLAFSVGLHLLLGKGMIDMLNRYELSVAAGGTANCIIVNIVVLLLTGILTFPPFLPLTFLLPLTIPLIIVGLFAKLWLMVRIGRNKKLLEASAII